MNLMTVSQAVGKEGDGNNEGSETHTEVAEEIVNKKYT